MRSRFASEHTGRWAKGLAGALLLALAWGAGARAEPPAPASGAAPPAAPILDPNVVQAGCASCGGGGIDGGIDGGCSGCGCGSGCYPGRDPAACCCSFGCDSACGRFLSDLYCCICCPDPCYEPHWTALADAAFFVDAARPVTQMRLRNDAGWGFQNPDRAEFFMAREHLTEVDASGKANNVGKGLAIIATKADYDRFSLYTEAAAGGRVSAFVELNYLSFAPTVSPADFAIDPALAGVSQHQSGFGDMMIGGKTLLLDCELVQFGFEFKTFLPTGNFTKGLGVGHVSLEPSLLLSLRLCPSVYLQHQMSIWIPLGGDALYEGNIYHNHLSLNFLLCRPCPGIQLIATAEFNQWLILNGNYTDPNFLVPAPGGGLAALAVGSRDTGIFSAGPGLRLVICDKIDFGVGSAFAVTGSHFDDQLVRAEFRWRF
jgi:hypothetical protein